MRHATDRSRPSTALALSILLAFAGACERPTRSALGPASCPASSASSATTAAASSEREYVRWLEERSMLHHADGLARRCSASGVMWRHPFAEPQPRAAAALASVWFTAYPAATIGRDGDSVVATLGDDILWQQFGKLGITGIHTGPMKRAGGIRGREYTPTVDGGFDRIGTEIDPGFGSTPEYLRLAANAAKHGGIVIGDIIPGHSGKGPDFRLAERGYEDYPGLYHMVQVNPSDWQLLPPVPAGRDSVNLSPKTVDELHQKGYIVGQLARVIFYEPGVKETNWSATDVVRGADGVERRWVYLHYFKEGQPTLNWLDPSFAAERMVLGDAVDSLGNLGERMLRLDANGFLGIEPAPSGPAWSEGHPLAVTANQLITDMVRKLGGFTFQELNLTLEDLKAMSEGGADLSYDFITRPAYHHALVTGDAEFLRLMLGLMHSYHIDPAGLIHALQNHDELTLELVHFSSPKHQNELFPFRGRKTKGAALRQTVIDEMKAKLVGSAAPYNLSAGNGVACTTASLVAAVVGVRDLAHITTEQRRQIQRMHVLLAMFNALQPGVFALSGWDLVGALTLPRHSVQALLADGDTRWVNRGAYDLLGANPAATKSSTGLPRATALYGSLPEQLRDPKSFASQLAHIIEVRQEHRIAESEQLPIPTVRATGLVVMVQRLPASAGLEVTALNFGGEPVNDWVELDGVPRNAQVTDILDGHAAGTLQGRRLGVKLEGYEGAAVVVR